MAKILVIDDSVSMSAFLRTALEKFGHQVVITNNGEDGINRLSLQRFDLAITDIYMPGRDGFEVILKIRKQQNATPIIAISTNSGLVDALHIASKLGASERLAKPFTESQLLDAVNRALRTDTKLEHN